MKPPLRPWSSYADLTFIAALFSGLLFLVLLFMPWLVHLLFNIASDPATDLMSRRAGVLFLGLGVIAFQARNAPQSSLRRAISLGFAIMWAGLALLGLMEFSRGLAGLGIWVAIVIETVLAALYFRFLFGHDSGQTELDL